MVTWIFFMTGSMHEDTRTGYEESCVKIGTSSFHSLSTSICDVYPIDSRILTQSPIHFTRVLGEEETIDEVGWIDRWMDGRNGKK